MSDKIKNTILAIFFFLVWSLAVLLIMRGSVFRYSIDFAEIVVFVLISIISYLIFVVLPVFFVRFLRLRSLYNKEKKQTIRYIISIILIIALISSLIVVVLSFFVFGWLDFCEQSRDCVSSNVCYYKVIFNPFSYYGLLSHQCVPFIFKYLIIFKISIYLLILSSLFIFISYPALVFYYALLKVKGYKLLKNKKRLGLSILLLVVAILWLLPVLLSSLLGLNALYCSSKNSYKCDRSIACSFIYNRCYPFYLKLVE
ncbi:hypothetical protein ACFL2U_00065 [Patescibacteria group bacterium]